MDGAGVDEAVGQLGRGRGQWLALLDRLDDASTSGGQSEETQRRAGDHEAVESAVGTVELERLGHDAPFVDGGDKIDDESGEQRLAVVCRGPSWVAEHAVGADGTYATGAQLVDQIDDRFRPSGLCTVHAHE